MVHIHEIKKYWLTTPERFAEQYETTRSFISPTKMFLHARRKKVLDLTHDVKGKKILDIGCGSGVFMIEFIKRGAYVVGADYSDIMLHIAEHELNRNKISKSKFKLIKADATRLPFKKAEFDIILATGLADYLTSTQNGLFIKGVDKALKKGGVLICGFPVKESPVAFLRSGLGLWIRKNIMKLPPIQSAFSIQDIRKLLKIAGLVDIKRDKVFQTMWIIVAKRNK